MSIKDEKEKKELKEVPKQDVKQGEKRKYNEEYLMGNKIKIIEDFKIEDKDPMIIMSDLYDIIYGFLARRVIDSFGSEGEQVVRRALRDYAAYRGKRLREKHIELGLDLDIVSLMTYYDLPTDDEQENFREIFTPDLEITAVKECSHCEKWNEMGMIREGIIYCEELHHAMWTAYNPDIVVTQPKIMTRGDEKCTFEIRIPRKSENKSKE